ncbi:MAG: hypothetical protein AAFV93_18665 [Chloroflexota bacterium]
MRALWETTENMLVLMGVGLVGIQLSFMFELYIIAGVMASLVLLASGVLLLQFYDKKRR